MLSSLMKLAMANPAVAGGVAVAKGLPWRAIGIGIAALVLVLTAWRASVWREGWQGLKAAERARDEATASLTQCTDAATAAALAYVDQQREAADIAAADKRKAQEIERDLQTKLDTAAGSARDLAGRLRDYQVRRRSVCVPAPANAPSVADAPSGVPDDGARVDAALARHLEACARDAERLDGWREWWTGVQSNR